MTLRHRIALLAAVAVAAAVLLASAGVYLAAATTFRDEIDRSLMEMGRDLARAGRGPLGGGPRAGRFGGAGGLVQVVGADGSVLGATGGAGGAGGAVGTGGAAEAEEPVRLPVSTRVEAVATGEEQAFFQTVTVGDRRLRVLTAPTRFDVAVQIARPLDEMDRTLALLRRRLLLAAVLGIGLAGGLGLVVARRAIRPVDDLTAVAEDVAATEDLARRIRVDRDDELGRLAQAFNAMLANLERSRTAQRQLVADASHELRTPLTSLRTNVEVLRQIDRLDPQQRRALLDDVTEQLHEFGRLVGALIELARDGEVVRAPTPLRLDEVVRAAVDRVRTFRRDAPPIHVDATPTAVRGEADRIERAVVNLLDNAVKYGGGTPVRVEVAEGRVRVRDHGPGIDASDLPHVFDRFYRSPAARSAPGSGLGLSIVEQVARSHGGHVRAANAPDGGAVFTLALPTASVPEPATRVPR